MVHAACPEVEECIKWNVPFFVYRGPLCAVAAFKAHCRIGFWKADILRNGPDAAALASLDRVTQVSEFPSRAALTALVRAAVKLNEDSVLAERQKAQHEKRKNRVPVKTPPALAAALTKNARARKPWDAFRPSHRRDGAADGGVAGGGQVAQLEVPAARQVAESCQTCPCACAHHSSRRAPPSDGSDALHNRFGRRSFNRRPTEC